MPGQLVGLMGRVRTCFFSFRARKNRAFLVTMAEEVRYKVKLLEEGQITVDAPISVFSADKKGYFTLFDNGAAAKGKWTTMCS